MDIRGKKYAVPEMRQLQLPDHYGNKYKRKGFLCQQGDLRMDTGRPGRDPLRLLYQGKTDSYRIFLGM